jgi:hypothetical protein
MRIKNGEVAIGLGVMRHGKSRRSLAKRFGAGMPRGLQKQLARKRLGARKASGSLNEWHLLRGFHHDSE